MKKEISEIKRRALLAKQRMKMGYWQKMQEERDRMMTVTADSSKLNLASSVRKREYEIVNKVAMGDDFAEKEEKLYVRDSRPRRKRHEPHRPARRPHRFR